MLVLTIALKVNVLLKVFFLARELLCIHIFIFKFNVLFLRLLEDQKNISIICLS